jgi:hypothetical protein
MTFRLRVVASFLILCSLVASQISASEGRRDLPKNGNETKPLFIIAVLIGEPAPSCEPGKPVAFLRVRVTNKSRVSTPAACFRRP